MPLPNQDGFTWIESQVSEIAEELGVQLDGPPEWDRSGVLNVKMAVEVAGQRKILTLWDSHIADSQGGNNTATREVRGKLQAQIRAFLEGFAPPKKRIGF